MHPPAKQTIDEESKQQWVTIFVMIQYMPHISVIGILFCYFTENYVTLIVWSIMLFPTFIFYYILKIDHFIMGFLFIFSLPIIAVISSNKISTYMLNKEPQKTHCATVTHIFKKFNEDGHPTYFKLDNFPYDISYNYTQKIIPPVYQGDDLCIQYTSNSKWQRYHRGLHISKINHQRYFKMDMAK